MTAQNLLLPRKIYGTILNKSLDTTTIATIFSHLDPHLHAVHLFQGNVENVLGSFSCFNIEIAYSN